MMPSEKNKDEDKIKGEDRLQVLIALASLKNDNVIGRCLSQADFASILDGGLDQKKHNIFLEHIDSCPECYSIWITVSSELSVSKTEAKNRLKELFSPVPKGKNAIGPCLTEETFDNMIDDKIDEKKYAPIIKHLVSCPECSDKWLSKLSTNKEGAVHKHTKPKQEISGLPEFSDFKKIRLWFINTYEKASKWMGANKIITVPGLGIAVTACLVIFINTLMAPKPGFHTIDESLNIASKLRPDRDKPIEQPPFESDSSKGKSDSQSSHDTWDPLITPKPGFHMIDESIKMASRMRPDYDNLIEKLPLERYSFMGSSNSQSDYGNWDTQTKHLTVGLAVTEKKIFKLDRIARSLPLSEEEIDSISKSPKHQAYYDLGRWCSILEIYCSNKEVRNAQKEVLDEFLKNFDEKDGQVKGFLINLKTIFEDSDSLDNQGICNAVHDEIIKFLGQKMPNND